MELKLKIASLNIWGVPFVAKYRRERVRALCTAIQAGQFDIIALQEVWIPEDRKLLIAAGRAGVMQHSQYFQSGVIGSGLLVLSTFPIVEHVFFRYSTNGKSYKIHHGDWFGGKGVGLSRILLPGNQVLDFYVTHLIAQYAKDDEYGAHRAAQAFELTRWVNLTQKNTVALLVGDLNTSPTSLEYRLLTQLGELKDLWSSVDVTNELEGSTFNNSYCAKDDLAYGLRLDYMMFRVLTGSVDRTLLLPTAAVLSLADIPQEGEFAMRGIPHYSDHTGLATTLSMCLCSGSSPTVRPPFTHDLLLRELQGVLALGISEAQQRQRYHYRQAAMSVLGWILLLICAYFMKSPAVFASFLAPLILVYGCSHIVLAHGMVKPESAALDELSEEVSRYVQYGTNNWCLSGAGLIIIPSTDLPLAHDEALVVPALEGLFKFEWKNEIK